VQFHRDGDFHRVVHITGPTHNLLDLSFAPGSVNHIPVQRLQSDPPTGSRSLDDDQIRQAVLAGIAEANAALGADYHVARIRYVPQDTADPEIYSFLAGKIIEHLTQENSRHGRSSQASEARVVPSPWH
jgi:hypothetical protein